MFDLHFIGVPFNSDGTPPAEEHPPRHLRDAGLLDRLAKVRSLRDRGDLPIPIADGVRDPTSGVLNWTSWQTVTEGLSASIGASLAGGGWPLVVGGDCSILVGIIAGAVEARGRCGLFFVDGHGDFHTPATSPTGEPADMELAALTGRAPSPAARSPAALLRDEDIVALGIRESDGIEATPIRVIDHERLATGGLDAAVRQATAALPPDLPVWLHLDVDVIDPALMPVIFPAGAGLTFREATTLVRGLLGSSRVIGMDVSCFHPNLDTAGTATAGLVDLLVSALQTGGGMAGGLTAASN